MIEKQYYVAKISTRGRITLPKALRAKIKVDANSMVVIKINAEE